MKIYFSKKNKLFSIVFLHLIFMLFLCIGICFSGCLSVDSFTEEQHINRITQRIDKYIEKYPNSWFVQDGKKQNIEVYPLYNQNEEAKYFLLECDKGFVIVSVFDESIFRSCLGFWPTMYNISHTVYDDKYPWTPYTRDENSPALPVLYGDGEEVQFSDRTGDLILDENGELILYTKSPYFVTGNLNKKKYLLETNDRLEYICAVREGDKYINLISGQETEILNEYDANEHATLYFIRYPYGFNHM